MLIIRTKPLAAASTSHACLARLFSVRNSLAGRGQESSVDLGRRRV